MTTPITNGEFAQQFGVLVAQFQAGLLSTDGFIAALAVLVNDWTVGAITPTQIGLQMSQALGNWNNFISGQFDFLTIGPTGGPHSNGTVDLVDYLGNVTTIPGLQLLQLTMARGFPAKNDLTLTFQAQFRTNEKRHTIVIPDDMAFQSAAQVIADSGPQGACTIRVTRNGTFVNPNIATDAEIIAALWFTASFPATNPQNFVTGTGVYANTPSLSKGDIVRTFGPLVQDPYLGNCSISFGGA